MTKLKKYYALFAGGVQEDFYTKSQKDAEEFAGKLAKKNGLKLIEVFTTD